MTQRLPPFGVTDSFSLHDPHGSVRLRESLKSADAKHALIEPPVSELAEKAAADRLASLIGQLDGVDVAITIDVENASPEELSHALKTVADAKIATVALALSAFEVTNEETRSAILRHVRRRPHIRFYATGSVTKRPDRMKMLGRSDIAKVLDGVIAPSNTLASELELRAILADWPEPSELIFAARAPVTPLALETLAQTSASRVYVDAGTPAATLRLARSSDRRMLRRTARLFRAAPGARTNPIVIIGGAGFIGSNLADRYARDGASVRIVDNLAREGVERNLAWLRENHGDQIEACFQDVSDDEDLGPALADARAVFHLAAQVAVTTSLDAPLEDFATNASGTLRILEHLRRTAPQTPLVFASTNKVYGCLENLAVEAIDDCWRPTDETFDRYGLSESSPLDLRTPYGCSKGVADQYVLDYAKSFGMRTAVLRMSCIYGPRQFGTEDQGWVAHFLMRCMSGDPITIFGDGRQVRDILHVTDAVEAYRLLLDNIDAVRGRAFNLGGGPRNAVSLLSVLDEIASVTGRRPDLNFSDWRSGDQPWFVADTRRLTEAVGWRGRIDWREGLRDLAQWLAESGVVMTREVKQAWRMPA